MLPSGKRNRRIIINRRSLKLDGIESVPTYSAQQARWAAIEPLSAKELLLAGTAEDVSEVTHKITILYTPDISKEDQILYRGRTFEVDSIINPLEEDRELVILAIERSA